MIVLKNNNFTTIEISKKKKVFTAENCGDFLSLTIKYAGERKQGNVTIPNLVEYRSRLEKLIEKMLSFNEFTQSVFCSCNKELFLFKGLNNEKELYISYYEMAGRNLKRIPAAITLNGNERVRFAGFLKTYINTHTFIDRNNLED